MALLVFNGFDFLEPGPLSTNIAASLLLSGSVLSLGSYSPASLQVGGPGRFGGNTLVCPGDPAYYATGMIDQMVPGRPHHAFIGFASMMTPPVQTPPANQRNSSLVLVDGATGLWHCYLEFCPFGVVKLWGLGDAGNQNFTLLGASDVGAYQAGAWNYYEVEAVIAPANAGFVTLRCNTRPVLAVSSVTTQSPASTNSTFGVVRFWDGWQIDDLYVCDDQGPAPFNTFLGNVRCQALLPAGPGQNARFTPSDAAKANWQCAGNTRMDDTLYVVSPTTGAEDSYRVSPLVNTPLVLAVQTRLAARQDDATQRAVEAVLISGATKATGASVDLSQSYAVQTDLFLNDPATGASWLYPAVNLLEVGQRITS